MLPQVERVMQRLPREDSSGTIYKTTRWAKVRRMQLARQPLCAICGKTATQVHHTVAVKTDPSKALDFAVLQSLCGSCHSTITASGANYKGK